MTFIEFHYGPYSENGTIKHRINRLMNLARYLMKNGHTVELIPSIHMDTLQVIIGLRVAFRCRLTFLSQLSYEVFGIKHDPVLANAIQTIDETLGRVGQVGPNVRVPGIYKGVFNISSDFGCGVMHNNYGETMRILKTEDDEDDSYGSHENLLCEEFGKLVKFSE